MPIHDLSRVDAAYFHSFCLCWKSAIKSSLNNGVLPSSHYALLENQRDGRVPSFADLGEDPPTTPDPGERGALQFVADAPPQTSVHDVCTHPAYAETIITIRRRDHNGVVAVLRIVGSETKRSRYRLGEFVAWTTEVLREGINLLVIDLLPPEQFAAQGIHKAIWDEFVDNDFALPLHKRLTLASYVASPVPEAFVEPTAVGCNLVQMPLFLDSGRYVNVPLELTYQRTFEAEPRRVRDLLKVNPDQRD